MSKAGRIPPELKELGKWVAKARVRQGLTQQELALRSGIDQPRVSRIEKGGVLPTLRQAVDLARALGVPLQWLLTGSTAPGDDVRGIAFELQNAGIVDLVVRGAVVPGAFRPLERVIALAVSGNQPEPRIVEAIPAVLAWNQWSPRLLRAYGRRPDSRVEIRLAWLADVALTIERTQGFPGGCRQRGGLESYIKRSIKPQARPVQEDDLGRPAEGDNLSPVWRRWRIRYAAPLTAFVERAQHLQSQRETRVAFPTQPSDG